VAKDLLQAVTNVMPHYKGVSLISLFDCIATIAETLGERMRTAEIASLLLPLLLNKLQGFSCNDRRLLPLFETLEQVVYAVGQDLILPYVQEVYAKAVQIVAGIVSKV
jgi:hypothetical protein